MFEVVQMQLGLGGEEVGDERFLHRIMATAVLAQVDPDSSRAVANCLAKSRLLGQPGRGAYAFRSKPPRRLVA